VKAFQKHGYSVDMLSLPGVKNISEENTGSQKKNRYLIPQIIFELFEIGYNLVDCVRLTKQLKKKRYVFLYERYSIFNVAGILASHISGIPIIIEASFTSKTSVYPERTKILSSLARAFDKFVFTRACGIVVVSNVLKDSLIKDFGVTEEKILVLPNAVDTDLFNPSIHNGAVKCAYGLKSKQVVGFVGGFYPWHGLNLLIDAAHEVTKILPDTKFLLVGDGPDKKSLEDMVVQNHLKDSVVFTGSIPYAKVAEHIAAFDIGIMPDSNDYGSPIKIFEYMAMGKPVLAPKISPIEEIIEDGVNGVIFTRLSKEALSRAIIKLLTDKELYQKISYNSRKDILEKHTWMKNAEAVLFHLNQLKKP
jgi:glycosyltransferase involved in cell wall biosynthesis